MDLASEIKGLKLPEAVSFDQRFGFGPWQNGDGEDDLTTNSQNPNNNGDWLNKAGDVVQVLPGLFCTIFPKQCRGRQSSRQAPVIVQQGGPQRDWLTTSLIVLVLAVLLILIFKK
ncbi:MAG: hypothetical protein AAF242_02705 [Bacteroidota bacterium]